MLAVLGPPWREVADPRAVLLGDPPVLTACDALAAAAPEHGVLQRASTAAEVRRAATGLSDALGVGVLIYRGAIQTRSGAWLWPFAQEMVVSEKARAVGPLTRRQFALAVERLARVLRGASTAVSRGVLQRVMRQLERPWPAMSPSQVDDALSMLAAAVKGIPASRAFRAAALTQLQQVAANVAERSAIATAGARGVGFTFSPVEAGLARHIGRDGLSFVTDEFGRRSAAFSRSARRIIAEGAREGLGYAEVGRDVAQAFRDASMGRDAFYYRVVANSTVSRARSFGELRGYQAAQIEYYMWEAVLDLRCCDICRFLHGQTFPVDGAAERMERALRMPVPEEAVNVSQWYRQVGDTIHAQPRHGPLGPPIAQVVQSARGRNDERGTFRTIRGPRDHEGTMAPPAHGNCRCYTVPVI